MAIESSEGDVHRVAELIDKQQTALITEDLAVKVILILAQKDHEGSISREESELLKYLIGIFSSIASAAIASKNDPRWQWLSKSGWWTEGPKA